MFASGSIGLTRPLIRFGIRNLTKARFRTGTTCLSRPKSQLGSIKSIGNKRLSVSTSLRNRLDIEEHWTSKPSVDRELPDPFVDKRQNRRYFWIYGIGVTLACVVIFNYEKSRSPIINSSLYFLRRSEIAKEHLGPNIAFASSWPWISGTLNTVKGDVDIKFDVAGSEGSGTIILKAQRVSKLHPFDVQKFILDVKGKQFDLTKDPTISFAI